MKPDPFSASPVTPVPIPPVYPPDQAAALQLQMQAIQPILPTPEKKWYDRVVDSILGEDPCMWPHDLCWSFDGVLTTMT